MSKQLELLLVLKNESTKICKKCGVEKRLNEFYRCITGNLEHQDKCKDCEYPSERRRLHRTKKLIKSRLQHRADTVRGNMKRCKTCKEYKELCHFDIGAAHELCGRVSECKSCSSLRNKMEYISLKKVIIYHGHQLELLEEYDKRKCTSCGMIKRSSDFYVARLSRKNGSLLWNTKCKTCCNKKNMERYEKYKQDEERRKKMRERSRIIRRSGICPSCGSSMQKMSTLCGRCSGRKNLFINMNGKLSKLHKNIKELLCLSDKGFVSEMKIDSYVVDELNEQKKLIVEINGDYVHANPLYYKSEDVIRLWDTHYTAQTKWDYDKIRIDKLKSLGYTVFIIWESDNLEQKKQELTIFLENGNKR